MQPAGATVSTLRYRVPFFDTDAMGVVHHANYIRYLELARIVWLDEHDLRYSAVAAQGMHYATTRVELDYRWSTRFDEHNARPLLRDYDLVLDAADNFPTRYLVNDAAVLEGKPVVHGSVYLYEGQVTIFNPPHGPCYRCMFPQPPAPGRVPSCAEAGVLGVLPGVIGMLQATEAIKILSGNLDTLNPALITIDDYQLTIFPDARTIIKGTEKKDIARALYAKYIGH